MVTVAPEYESHSREAWYPMTKKSNRELEAVAAHELGHTIAHIVTGTYFYNVWVAGASEWWDRIYKDDIGKYAGCVRVYQYGKLIFDGERVRRGSKDTDPEDLIVTLLAGIAGEEVAAGREKPRSIVDISCDYRLRESQLLTWGSAGDFGQAQKWVKKGVENGYFHGERVWEVLQHYYNQAFYLVRDHKEFLLTASRLLLKNGCLHNTDVMKVWHYFYQIDTKKVVKETRWLDTKDNVCNATEEEQMNFNELETFVLHELSSSTRGCSLKDGDIQYVYGNRGVRGNQFAYVEGRRYRIRGLSKKMPQILYHLQRIGRVTATDGKVTATLPEGIVGEPVSGSVWAKDFDNVMERFQKDVERYVADPSTHMNMDDLKHLVENYPVTEEVKSAYAALSATVKRVYELHREEYSARQAHDILSREVVTINGDFILRQRFVLELSPNALKGAATQASKDYLSLKPEKFDKMKKREREKSNWQESTLNSLNKIAEAGASDIWDMNTLARCLTPKAAHAAWRIEAARRHPDSGGSAEASAIFGAIWDRIEKSLAPVEPAAA